MISKAHHFIVTSVYADHNKSRVVENAIQEVFDKHGADAFYLNIGSGDKRIREHVQNLDIIDGGAVDIVGSAENIPLKDNSVDAIISQEAFEHIQNPELALKECFRVLRPGGSIYFQVPFIIGYHPGPTDYLRFTKEGVVEFLTRAGFQVKKIEISVGGATGFYRCAVEFFAILFSGPIHVCYKPSKGFFAVLLYPIKLLDAWFHLSSDRDRIAGGYCAIAQKPAEE